MSDVTDLTFRYAAPGDRDALHNLIERAYRGPETAGRWDSESHILKGPRTDAAFIEDRINDEDSRFVIAERDGALVGCALIQKAANTECANGEAANADAYFGMFAIDPDIRSGGLGRAVLAECERRVRDLWNPPGLMMTVISIREQLIDWYERRGYELTGERLPFPFSETTGEVRRDFDLLVLRKPF